MNHNAEFSLQQQTADCNRIGSRSPVIFSFSRQTTGKGARSRTFSFSGRKTLDRIFFFRERLIRYYMGETVTVSGKKKRQRALRNDNRTHASAKLTLFAPIGIPTHHHPSPIVRHPSFVIRHPASVIRRSSSIVMN